MTKYKNRSGIGFTIRHFEHIKLTFIPTKARVYIGITTDKYGLLYYLWTISP